MAGIPAVAYWTPCVSMLQDGLVLEAAVRVGCASSRHTAKKAYSQHSSTS